MKLLLLALLATGCILKPDRLGLADDAGGSGSGSGSGSGIDAGVGGALVPRVVGKGYWQESPAGGSMGMGALKYEVDVDPITDGDLVLLIGNIDNDPHVMPPSGFTEVFGQKTFGPDKQTFFAFEKVASGEPVRYTGTYDVSMGSTSGAATILAVVITGARPSIVSKLFSDPCNTGTSICGTVGFINTSSPGVATTAGNIVLYAAGGDWFINDREVTFAPPNDFTMLAMFTDRDADPIYRWTTMMVGYKPQDASAAVQITSQMTTAPDGRGEPFSIALAIAPL